MNETLMPAYQRRVRYRSALTACDGICEKLSAAWYAHADAQVDAGMRAWLAGLPRRLDVAIALAGDPELLFLDEPTSGLDPKQIIEIRELLRALAGEHTIILSTHILSEVEHSCERVIIVNKGRIKFDDTLRSIGDREPVLQLEVRGPSDAVTKFLQEQPELATVEAKHHDGDLTTFEERYSRPIDRGDAEATRRLSLLLLVFEVPQGKPVLKERLAQNVEERVRSAFLGLAQQLGLLTMEALLPAPLRQEELARRVLSALGVPILGETLAESADRLGKLDSARLLAETTRAQREAEERAYLKKLQGELKGR